MDVERFSKLVGMKLFKTIFNSSKRSSENSDEDFAGSISCVVFRKGFEQSVIDSIPSFDERAQIHSTEPARNCPPHSKATETQKKMRRRSILYFQGRSSIFSIDEQDYRFVCEYLLLNGTPENEIESPT